MASEDPAFLFYPGNYLRDTQCLSEAAQVAYDRIMCEHMRNICISQAQLDFFTKRLTPDQKSEVMMVLRRQADGFCIPWVQESIIKRREYSESRRKNRTSKGSKEPEIPKKTSSSYVPHMENIIENENEIVIGIKNESFISVLKKYANEKMKVIHDLQLFFASTGQLQSLQRAGWVDFDGFMANNPAAVFDDDKHVYNSYRRFHELKRNGKKKELTIDDIT